MSEKQARLNAISALISALKTDAAMQAKFRAAFPQFAQRLLDSDTELSDAEMEKIAGGSKWLPY